MAGHVAIRHISVLDFEQHVACPADEDRAERMIAMGMRAPRHLEAAAQKLLVVKWSGMERPRLSGRSAEFFRDCRENSIRLERRLAEPDAGRIGERVPIAAAIGL